MNGLPELNLREQIERIDRMHEEGLKFVAEQRKRMSESAKLDRDRVLSPWIVSAAVLGAALGLINVLDHLFGC